MNIVWKRVDFKTSQQKLAAPPKAPSITVNSKSGRIALNAAACGLIPELFFYDHIAVVKGFSEEQQVAWGIQFIRKGCEPAGDFKIHKVHREDDSVRSCVIGSKKLARMLVNEAKETMVMPVTKVNDFMLEIDVVPASPADGEQP